MAILQNTTVSGSLVVTGDLTARQYILSSSVSYFTESFASGSTRFGDSMDDTMKVTGSLLLTGSMTAIRGYINSVDGDYAFIVDYKTGSNKYPDPKQLRLMSLMTFAHFPNVNKIKAGLLFVMHGSFITEEYERKDIDKSWEKFYGPLERLDSSYDTNVWPPNPTPLCRFCPVRSCDFNRA
jgi:hypothetical protein